MRKIIISLLAIGMVAASADAKSPKRGISENQFSVEGQMTPIEPGVSWYYNWANTPGKGYENQVINFAGFEFVPMAWNGVKADAVREYCATHPEVKYILGFNEPNFTDQANMTPAQAAEKWPQVTALAQELGLEVVAPALNYSTGTYAQPTTWMDEFVSLVGLDAFDYTAIHCYGGLGVLKDLATTFYEKYGKPVWVTEFCYWPGGAGDVNVAPSTQVASMIESVEWMEKTDFIYRYAWFKAIGHHDTQGKPNYGLMVNQNGDGERQLSQQGWTYTYMTDYDLSIWHEVEEVVAATEFVTSHAILIDKGENADCPRPIEISQFNAGAYTDYQFDIPAAGTYYVNLIVSGQGEPVRFDPKVSVMLLDGDNAAELATRQFTLSGDATQYTAEAFEVTLPQGHVTLRLQDANPMQPSGIHISTVQVSKTPAAGITDISADAPAIVDVYNTLGMRVRHGVSAADATCGLPAGIYIVGTSKVIVK